MSMTMPSGFRTATKKPEAMKQNEIKDVVKSYFDKSPSTQLLSPPTQGSSPKNIGSAAYSAKEFQIAVGSFTQSPPPPR